MCNCCRPSQCSLSRRLIHHTVFIGMILSRAEEEIERIGCYSQLGGAKGSRLQTHIKQYKRCYSCMSTITYLQTSSISILARAMANETNTNPHYMCIIFYPSVFCFLSSVSSLLWVHLHCPYYLYITPLAFCASSVIICFILFLHLSIYLLSSGVSLD